MKVSTIAALAAAGLAGAAAAKKAKSARRPEFAVSRSSRNVELTKLGASTGAEYARMQLKSVGASTTRKSELRTEFEIRTAEQAVQRLGQMKGALMKIGQMASYLDQGLPEHVRTALAELQSSAPPMAIELVYEQIEMALGSPPDLLFQSFSDEPIASASIGQVHRAVTQDGRHVAVKVQYPGVDRAIEADLKNSDLLFNAMSTLFPGLDPGPIVEELRARISEELDYSIEAGHQRRFARYYEGHPYIYVPAVVSEFSTRRVLTTEFVQGATWAEMVEWSQAERDLAAETLYRFAFGGIYRLGAFNGDPHPGNYLFQPGGKVAFLDFGLCKVFTPDEVDRFEQMVKVMVFDRDPGRVRETMVSMGVLNADAPIGEAEILEYFDHFFEPVLKRGPHTLTAEYASASVRRYFDLSGPMAAVIKSVTLPSFMVLIQRINLGLYALLGELNATADWRSIAEELWPFVDGPPSTAIGESIAIWEQTRRAHSS